MSSQVDPKSKVACETVTKDGFGEKDVFFPNNWVYTVYEYVNIY